LPQHISFHLISSLHFSFSAFHNFSIYPMSLLFQNPALLGLLALAGLPALVHLLSRARPPVYRFSNLDFMRRVIRQTARVRRPKDWLLLALRTLAVLALAAAFASPFLVSKSAALPGEKTTVVILIDRSASMAARDGVGTRFDAACTEAAAYLDEADPAAANIVWIDAEPDAVFPEPGPNLAFLTDSLKQARPRPEAGALAAAFDLAMRQFAAAGGRRELIVLSDFQAAAWKEFSPVLPADLTVRTRRFSNSPAPNTAVTRVIPQPSQAVAGQDLTVLVQTCNFSPDPVRAVLTLDADGARQSQDVELTAWGAAESAFVLRPARPGPLPLSAALQGDAFPADDSRYAVVTVRDSLHLVFDGPRDAPGFRLLEKAATALGWLEVSQSSAETKAPDFRFLASWDGTDPGALREQAAAGTTLLVKPAPSCPMSAVRQLLGIAPDPAAGPLALDASPAGWQAVPSENHPAHQLFRSGDFGNPYAGNFRERLRIPSSLTNEAPLKSIATYADGVPAVLEFSTRGASVVLWNLPLDPAKTDWPTQGVFLPAMGELLLRLRPRAAAEAAYTLPGSPISWSSSDPAHAGAVRLMNAAGETVATGESATQEGTTWRSVEAAIPGMFRWEISGQPVAFSAVNFPESESDLRSLDEAPTFGRGTAPAGSLARQAALARGIPLWPWLAAAALLFLTLESLIHTRSPIPGT
jgi:hypothetical protein